MATSTPAPELALKEERRAEKMVAFVVDSVVDHNWTTLPQYQSGIRIAFEEAAALAIQPDWEW